MTDYHLTDAQRRVFAELRRAVAKCSRAGIYLFDSNNAIYGINGRRIHEVLTEADRDRADEPLRDFCDSIQSKAWNGSFSDDALYIKRSSGEEP